MSRAKRSVAEKDDFFGASYLCSVANRHEVYFLWRPSLKDPKDEMVLELVVTAGCHHIVTYNKRDFAGVERFGIAVIDAREFLKTIGEIA